MASPLRHAHLLTPLFEHICLPPRLPEREDDKLVEVGKALNERLRSAARELHDFGMFV